MTNAETSPLLAPSGEDTRVNETTPLLDSQSGPDTGSDERAGSVPETERTSWWPWPAAKPRRSDGSNTKQPQRWRWPSIIAIAFLAIAIICIILIGFLVPPVVKDYAEAAAVLEPTDLSLESITANGVRARIQANFRLDASRVTNKNTRRIGEFATSIIRKIELDKTMVHVYLPQHDNALLGTARVPSLTIDLVNGHKTAMDFVADLAPGDADKIRLVANDWLSGRLDRLKVAGATAFRLKSGILPLGSHDVVKYFVLEANDIPSMPDFRIQRLDFHDLPPDRSGKKAVGADVSISLYNGYPVSLDIPRLAFEVLVPNCSPSEPYIKVGDANSSGIHVVPKENITADAKGVIRELPASLIRSCPQTDSSPLDNFMKHYLNGEDAEVYVKGKKSQDANEPEWIGSLIEGITAPVEFPGRSFDNFIRNFSLTNVDFKLPSPFASPEDPDGKPRVSGTIQVLAALPNEFSIDLLVESLRANANLFYKKKKLGELNLHRWQKAGSTKIITDGEDQNLLNITSRVVDAPIEITDSDVFSDVLQKLLLGGGEIPIDIDAAVDVKVTTALGSLVLKGVPAQGQIPVKPLPSNTLGSLAPALNDLRILNTSSSGINLHGTINVTNPTPYTANVPYIHVHIHDSRHGRLIGEAVARHVQLELGNNTGLAVNATWDPASLGGEKAHEIGRQLLSDYLSGKNTTITVRTHRDSIPGLPQFGEAMSKINLTFPLPRINLPGNDDDDDGGEEGDDGNQGQRFIRDATFHIFSSSATFTLASPLHYDTVYIEQISATAFYNHTEPIGYISHSEAFAAPPGLSQTPRLPVDWSSSHVGYDKLKAALGGTLKLDAVANVTLRLGKWTERIHYEGKGLGARVSL